MQNVVLDLDETLINAHPVKKMTDRHYRRAKYFDWERLDNKYIVTARPGLQEFLDWLFVKFYVTVWTAASRSYASFILNKFIMTNSGRIPLYVFSSEHCSYSKKHGDSIKDLKILCDTFPSTYNLDNTILVDDRKDVCAAGDYNSYNIEPFKFLGKSSYEDVNLGKLKKFLKRWNEDQ